MKPTKKTTKKSFIEIGELVEKLKEFYPDLTRSKLRFLESKGIITPKRSGNRYRIYYKDDVKKLNYILKMQKEYFMPLDIIKEKIDSINFKRRAWDKSVLKVLKLKTVDKDRSLKSAKLTTNEIKDKYKLSQEYINDLLDNNIISWKEEDGKFIIDGKDIKILNIICELSKYGIQVKHLKLFENFANRHSSFIKQIVIPLFKSSSKISHKKASKTLYKLENFFCELHSLLVKKENKKFLEMYK